MINKPYIISGGIHSDERGQLTFLNDFDMSEIKRFYIISNSHSQITNNKSLVTNNQIRAWQGHKIEQKYFYVNQGSFLIAAVKIDDWDNPSKDLIPSTFTLNAKKPQILYIPPGYANGVKPMDPDSMLTIYSNLNLSESIADDYRFDKGLWMDWDRE